MIKPVLFIAVYSVLALACNNGRPTSVKTPLHDSLNEQAIKIKNSVDSSKAQLMAVQTQTQQELDSLNKLLHNDAVMMSMGVAAFTNMRNAVGERLAILEKLSQLQPLEQTFDNSFTEFSHEDHATSTSKEKLAKLDSTARVFEDSIRSTLNHFNAGK